MTELTNQEISVLIKALDSHQDAPMKQATVAGIMGIMSSSREHAEAASEKAHSLLNEAERQKEGMADYYTLLKAKLIHLKDAVAVTEVEAMLAGEQD